ncbi:unnamed protein product [Linum tenue]|uniref:anthocyanidin 3-O-glucosyltransferase n=1 Tax=Linum tenue TaxID=586396 RepID=A0AAV0RDG5_9ROSI|nr:unnamed protein product [Linum tenue]
MDRQPTVAPHVVFLPFPAQGHVKPMFMLAKLLCHVGGFQATFVNTEHNHALLQRTLAAGDLPAGFTFLSLPDAVPHDREQQQSSISTVRELFNSIRNSKPDFRRLVAELSPTCIIADGIMSLGFDVAVELGIPVIAFRTFSAVCAWVYFHLRDLIEQRVVPIPADADMDQPITSIPGLEGILRRRDLPSICRHGTPPPILNFFLRETESMRRASGLILNTFDGLEGPLISRLSTIFPKIFPVGPLHGLLSNVVKEEEPLTASNGGLKEEDRSCMTWLDSQPSRSVIFVSFGSLVALTEAQFVEFWHGLVNSGKPFLWVVRSDSVLGEDEVPSSVEVLSGLKSGAARDGSRCCVVDWAPQVEVLAHEAVGGFLTHSGWNSTVESVLAGVSMACWPRLSDQQVNSRAVSDVWRIGLDMKDTWDRSTVEKTVRELMEGRRDEIMKSTIEMAGMARGSVEEGGSSYHNLEKLIVYIRSMC